MPVILKRLVALAVAVVSVHIFYLGVILPNVESVMAIAQSQNQSVPRNFFIILKDLEQEVCIILMFWGLYLIMEKITDIIKNKYLFEEDLLELSATDGRNTIDTVKASRRRLGECSESIAQTPLVRVLLLSLDRFLITKDVHSTSQAIDSSVDALATSLEAENSMIRYLIWAIPSIGFIGTVRGIGSALAQADQALQGDIAGMTNSLGIAFNSTFVALIISIFLMFVLHQLQSMQDGLVVDIRDYCEKHIMKYISK